jgi:hypothetical protein
MREEVSYVQENNMEEKTESQQKHITVMLERLEANLNLLEKSSYALNQKLESIITPREGALNQVAEAPMLEMSPLARKLEDLMYITVRTRENLEHLERDVEL